MVDFDINRKVADVLDVIQSDGNLDSNYKVIKMYDQLRKILQSCYNAGLMDSTDNKPRITKTND